MTKRAVYVGAALGLFLPLLILLADSLSSAGWWPQWVPWVWPTSYMLISTAGKKEVWDYLVIAIAITVNAALYGYLASIISRVLRAARRADT